MINKKLSSSVCKLFPCRGIWVGSMQILCGVWSNLSSRERRSWPVGLPNWWVWRMRDIPRWIPDDRVDRHGNDPRRMRDRSLMAESIGMVKWWIPDDRVDRHGRDPMGQEDAWRIPKDGVNWHSHDPMGQEDAWWIPDNRVDRHGHNLMGRICWRPLDTWWPSGRSVLYIRMVSRKVPDDTFGDQILFWWAHDTFGNRRL